MEMCWLIGGNVMAFWWKYVGLLVEMWWLIGGNMLAYWWKYVGLLVEICWLIGGNMLAYWWKCAGLLVEMSWPIGEIWWPVGNTTDFSGSVPGSNLECPHIVSATLQDHCVIL